MSACQEDNDSDAPEEFTSQQGIQQDEEIRKIQRQNKARVRRDRKEQRRKQAERLTPRPQAQVDKDEGDDEMVEDEAGADASRQSQVNTGMLPNDIVNLLAAREKQVFSSDSDEEKIDKKKLKPKKKRIKKSGVETVILNELPSAPCVQKSLEFLKNRKMQVARSPAILNNSNKALRLLSSSGLLK